MNMRIKIRLLPVECNAIKNNNCATTTTTIVCDEIFQRPAVTEFTTPKILYTNDDAALFLNKFVCFRLIYAFSIFYINVNILMY